MFVAFIQIDFIWATIGLRMFICYCNHVYHLTNATISLNSLHMCSFYCKYCSYKLSRRVVNIRKTHCSCQKCTISNIIWPYGIIIIHTVTLLLFLRCTKRKLSQGNYIAVIIRYASSNIMKGQEFPYSIWTSTSFNS